MDLLSTGHGSKRSSDSEAPRSSCFCFGAQNLASIGRATCLPAPAVKNSQLRIDFR